MISARRQEIIAEARSWLGTPYLLNQCVKGAGVDCARFIHAVMYACGLIPPELTVKLIEIFGPNWSCHTDDPKYQKYIFRMLRHSKKLLTGFTNHAIRPLPGSVVLVRTPSGRVSDHGGIVTGWPRLIHAVPDAVEETSAGWHFLWGSRLVEAYDPLGGEE